MIRQHVCLFIYVGSYIILAFVYILLLQARVARLPISHQALAVWVSDFPSTDSTGGSTAQLSMVGGSLPVTMWKTKCAAQKTKIIV